MGDLFLGHLVAQKSEILIFLEALCKKVRNYLFGRLRKSQALFLPFENLTFMKRISLFLSLLLSFMAKGQGSDLERDIRKLYDRELKREIVHDGYLRVYSPSNDLNIAWAEGETATLKRPFHSASIGKTFTAIACMQLVEEGKLSLDLTLSELLDSVVYKGLHLMDDGVVRTPSISLLQLLNHSSGLPDYFEDSPEHGPDLLSLSIAKPDTTWTPLSLLEFARQMPAHFKPGEGYKYNDTEYILLGLIIEKVSGLSLADYFEQKIFAPLEMNNTYMHLRAPQKGLDLAGLYIDEVNIAPYKSLSLDWAGGGLATTMDDLLKFQIALNTNVLISADSYQFMQKWTRESAGFYYGLGLRKINMKGLFFTLADLNLIGHNGSTGSFMFYCPELDVYVNGSFNQLKMQRKAVVFLTKIFTKIEKEHH